MCVSKYIKYTCDCKKNISFAALLVNETAVWGLLSQSDTANNSTGDAIQAALP